MARLVRSRTVLAATFVALALALVAGLGVVQADPVPDLPAVSADRLLASAALAAASDTPASGTVRTHVDLGLPQLPSNLGDPTSPIGVLLADQTFKYWRSPDGVRVAQLLPFAERDAIATPTDVWLWDSERFTAWHAAGPGASQPPLPSLGDVEAIAAHAIRAIAPYATVDLGQPEVVAGRPAYVVTLTPTSSDTLVGHVDLAIDAGTRLPLRLGVVPKASADAALEVGFTSIDLGPVDPGVFSFTPPDGATVKQLPAGDHHPQGDGTPPVSPSDVRWFGEGFGLVLAVRLGDVPRDVRPLLPYAGPLGSVDLVEREDHAWLVGGLVSPASLQAVEPKLP